MSRPRSTYVVFSLIFIVITHIASLKQTHLSFVHFLECLLLFFENVDEESESSSNSESSVSGCCLSFA